MSRELVLALNRILSLDRESIARAGGAILQELCIRDPAQWAGSSGRLGELIREEILDGNTLKPKYVKAGETLSRISLVSGNYDFLSSLILRVGAINAFLNNA